MLIEANIFCLVKLLIWNEVFSLVDFPWGVLLCSGFMNEKFLLKKSLVHSLLTAQSEWTRLFFNGSFLFINTLGRRTLQGKSTREKISSHIKSFTKQKKFSSISKCSLKESRNVCCHRSCLRERLDQEVLQSPG